MKKIFTFLMILLFISCSQDEPVDELDTTTASDFLLQVNQGKFDDSNLGLYKGVFTTNDGQNRATVRIEMNGKDNPVAILNTPQGETLDLKAVRQMTRSKSSDEISFASNDVTFNFSVDENGENPIVSNVIYKGLDGAIMLAKQTSKQPIETVTGTYQCVDCSTHPDLGEQPETQTFNFVFSGTDDDATVETQFTLKHKTYGPGAVSQTDCTQEGDFTICDLVGTLVDEDETGENLAFFGDSGPVFLTGIHTYNNTTTGLEDCSSISGNLRYESTRFGTSLLSFQSDENTSCEVPGFQTLIFEDFEDHDVEYIMTRRDDNEEISDDLARLEENRYYGILINQDPPNVNYTNGLGEGYFGAQNTNSAANPVNRVRLTWRNVDISEYSLLDFSLFFATFDDDADGDWDQNARAGVEYSFDGGTTWEKILAVEAGPGDPGEDVVNDFVYQDVNFDGIGDVAGMRITESFTRLSRQLETEGNSTMDVRIYIRVLDNDQEDIAVDNFHVTGR